MASSLVSTEAGRPALKKDTIANQLTTLLTYLRSRRLLVQKLLANGTSTSIDVVNMITHSGQQLAHVTRNSRYVAQQLSL